MIRVRGQGKYELLSTTSDDELGSSDQALRVEGVLNRRRDEGAAEDESSRGAAEFSGPRHRKSSREKEEKRRLLGPGCESKEETIELSEKMLRPNKTSPSSSTALSSDFIEVNIKDDDTLPGLALKYRCPVSELKRVNNIYSTQDIHSFKRIKVPVKKHGLLKEILDDDAGRRRSKSEKASKRDPSVTQTDSVVNVDNVDDNVDNDDDDDDDDECSVRLKVKDSNSPSRLDLMSDDGDTTGDPTSAYRDSSLPPECRYGIKDLENLFPNRDISDCESGAEGRRVSASGGGSDSGSDSATPLVRTFYLSIRENMSQTSPNQSSLAKEFLSKMDKDLSTIRRGHPTAKNSLDEVTSTLTSKRIHPLSQSTPPPPLPPPGDETEVFGTLFGMSWRALLGLSVGVGILLFFVFFNYARQRETTPDHHVQSNSHSTTSSGAN